MLSDMIVDPISWIGPTVVFAVASMPFAWLSRFAVRRTRLQRDLVVLPIIGGLAFGFSTLQIDRWINMGLTSLFQNISGINRTLQFATAIALSGMLAVVAQCIVAIIWGNELRDLISDEP